MNGIDIFGQINNAVLDLQAAQLQTYERPLKTLARLLQHPDLDATNRKLTENVDLEEFLSESLKTQGGMAGSAKLAWPDNHEMVLGITILLVEKFAKNPNELIGFGYTYFGGSSRPIVGIQNAVGSMIIPFVRDYKAFVMNQGNVKPKLLMPASNRVFIVHGHDDGAREAVARFLERLGIMPIILHEQANQGRTVIEKVEAHGEVGFAVVLLTPDDEGAVKGGTPMPRARQNVLLELGYFIGRLGRKHVCALKRGEVDIPSDFGGVVYETFDESGGWKQALGRELQEVGFHIDWNIVMRSGTS